MGHNTGSKRAANVPPQFLGPRPEKERETDLKRTGSLWEI